MRTEAFLQAMGSRLLSRRAEGGRGRFALVCEKDLTLPADFARYGIPPLPFTRSVSSCSVIVEMKPTFVVLSAVHNSKNVSADQARFVALTVGLSTW